jgi:hypothetical protein
MTNYGTLAILALPKMPERRLRFLLALETVTCDADGWRKIGTGLLASKAGLSVTTATRARRDLVASGAVEYERGDGKGHLSAYRMKVPHDVVHLPEPGKVPSNGDDLEGGHNGDDLKGGHNGDDLKGGHNADDLSGPGKVVKQAPQRSSNRPLKGSHRIAATSGNAIGGLEPYGLGSSGLRAARRHLGAADIIRAVYPSATDDEIEIITKKRIDNGARSAEAVLAYEVRQGTLRLPCDRDGPDSHSGACRDGNSSGCAYHGAADPNENWCVCRCHTEPVVRLS